VPPDLEEQKPPPDDTKEQKSSPDLPMPSLLMFILMPSPEFFTMSPFLLMPSPEVFTKSPFLMASMPSPVLHLLDALAGVAPPAPPTGSLVGSFVHFC